MNTILMLGMTFLAPAVFAEDNPWHGDFARARALARQANKPLFVVFRCER
jgi:hypothetical protein